MVQWDKGGSIVKVERNLNERSVMGEEMLKFFICFYDQGFTLGIFS